MSAMSCEFSSQITWPRSPTPSFIPEAQVITLVRDLNSIGQATTFGATERKGRGAVFDFILGQPNTPSAERPAFLSRDNVSNIPSPENVRDAFARAALLELARPA